MHLHLGDNPRTLYLVTSPQEERDGYPSKALVFRAVDGNSSQAIVQFLPKDQVDLDDTIKLSTRNVYGCLGLISVSSDIFLVMITSASPAGNTRPSSPNQEGVAQIHEVAFYSLTSSTWDGLSPNLDSASTPAYGDQPDAIYGESFAANGVPATYFEHPCAPIAKIMSAGTFYYAQGAQWDLSSHLSLRLARKRTMDGNTDIATYDDRFVWNEYVVKSLLDFRARLDPQERDELDRTHFIVLAIQGYVGVFTLALPPAQSTSGSPVIATLSLISRLGWKRSGTRFNTRGVDDDGNCANFVETETIFSTEHHCFSYVQVRGSVPLFWEQQGLQTFGQRIQITRPQASQPAFDRHFLQLTEEYGAVHAIDLLGSKENEAILTNAYQRHLHLAQGVLGNAVGITHFDFHNAVKIGGHESVFREVRRVRVFILEYMISSTLRRLQDIVENIEKFGFTMIDAASDELITEQKGVFRTNCLDCLDRTNFVQDILSRTTLEQYLKLIRKEWSHANSLWSNHREAWAENGDTLSRIYAGTGALNTSFTRTGKRTLAGVLSDATKSVSRAYINNFQDKGKQTAIDVLVGNMAARIQVELYDPIHDSVRRALEARLSEYSTTIPCTVFVGTWNLNGRPPSAESLLPWLFPRPNTADPDIFAIGFQEIVPLTAQQIVQADPERRRAWEGKILGALNQRSGKKDHYVLLRSHQLVGTALLILVKSELTSLIRNVEAATQKTGLRGMSGNKGAVAIRLNYHDTGFCFITAHLAAGHTNIDERNADYRTIANNLHFLKGRTIDSHDNIVWLADTNYRIDLENDRVRFLAGNDDYDALLAADQLKRAIDDGLAFPGYQEGPLLFRPTYKYDVGSDKYDTGEKMRIPAWTDRILYKGSQLDLAVYSRAELKSSDHRPVFSLFRAGIRIIDHVKRETLSRLLLENVTSTVPGEKLEEKLAKLTFSANAESLPPPSSEEVAWWDGPGHPDGIFVPISPRKIAQQKSNPFDSPVESPLSSSPTSSEEEIYHALQSPMAPVQAGRRPAPAPPPRGNKPIPNNNA
ncbi:DNase I-like protein [Laetiporus sulphureus 93-53]|uniref:phosphoinositide 5-phosphatase n=1 Tax=Laetiporus sulphureus 93-53 TaxID=1314785 RepID=A0A165IFU8_9APHY|nr:DNase I-like protein [Laetiporus sulphureus 93-53]KZT13014.1 DNase I-like protein [Laetiporus sulphureus 93-53]